ncbi:MAG: citrate/2-methylcitrate synthase [Lachnospiraceae bacterium]|nr:citrate/2-methylcitrate synthase [Lachnospiraceae bacterium]
MAESEKNYSEITPEIRELAKEAARSTVIDSELYRQYDVKRGLRDLNGKGVLAGLTHISDIQAKKVVDGKDIPTEGHLYYRGYEIEDLVRGFTNEKRFGFEEITYLLLFGHLPSAKELDDFGNLIGYYRSLPTSFVRDIIMKAPSHDMMNSLARSVLTLYTYDDAADDISIENVLRQCIQLIALFPMLCVYGFHAYAHYHDGESLIIHQPDKELSTAENLLRILRPDSEYTELEARILDVALVLHMDHGGGNNSTFTTHVVSSTGTDTYSAVAASLGSLKGPRHGGANIKVVRMMEDLKHNVHDVTNEGEVRDYLKKLLHKEAFDRNGLIYGMGHAVYSISDPREKIFRSFVEKLADEKGYSSEFNLYSMIERLGPEIIAEERQMYKGVCCNVDFYSGFVYKMLGLPEELFTPIFACARIAGWSAHRIEELSNNGKIIRPAYKPVSPISRYVPIDER